MFGQAFAKPPIFKTSSSRGALLYIHLRVIDERYPTQVLLLIVLGYAS